MLDSIEHLITDAQKIVVLQADNPDADSLGSALALEQLLEEQGKDVALYCGIQMPEYLHYLSGWDRVIDRLPSTFDLSIIVDTSAVSLLAKLNESGQQGMLASRPCIVLDHHEDVVSTIPFATVVHNDPGVSSTGELIYQIAQELEWQVDATSAQLLLAAIMGDTQGLTNNLATPQTYRCAAALIDAGASRPALEEARRDYTKMHPTIFKYKARLIERTEHFADGRLALVTVPQAEINEFSSLYNPAPLIQPDMLQTIGVGIALVIKHYDDGKILCSIRCNTGYPVAAELAEHFNGGGHAYAAGFKLIDGRPLNEVKSECTRFVTELLQRLDKEQTDEAIQHPDA